MSHRWSPENRTPAAVASEAFVTAASDAVEGIRAGDRLRAIAVLRCWLPLVERDAVEQAVATGATWQGIGAALGVSRQAAHAKHASVRESESASPRSRIVVERTELARVKAEQNRLAEEYFERLRQRRTER